MSGYLADTNIPSELTRDRPDPRVSAFLQTLDQQAVFLSVLTIGEICKGIATLSAGNKRETLQQWLNKDLRPWFAGRILPVTEPVAELWADLAANARRQGKPLAVVDGLIAATALHHGLKIITRNTSDFEHLGVPLVNPWSL